MDRRFWRSAALRQLLVSRIRSNANFFEVLVDRVFVKGQMRLRTSRAWLLGFCFISLNAFAEAKLNLNVVSDSTGVSGMHYAVDRYANAACGKAPKPRKLFRKKFARNSHDLGEISIPSGETFWLQVNYQESRRGEQRLCNYLIGFDPVEGGRYSAEFKTSGQVSACSMQLNDTSGSETNENGQLAVNVPEQSCEKAGRLGNPNGTAVHKALKRF